MRTKHTDKLIALFIKIYGSEPTGVQPLPRSGSSRIYYRLISGNFSCIGTYNPDVRENEAFIYLSAHLDSKSIPVPKVLVVSECRQYYLQTDLGLTSLMDIINSPEYTPDLVKPLLHSTLESLIRFQVDGYNGLDKSKLYPIALFDRKSVFWDLYYFKYCFLKTSGIVFDEVILEDSLDYLADIVLNCDLEYLQFRDFQSRNVMILNKRPYFIDFQGARVGPGLYDLASFLYQAKANFSVPVRDSLLEFYLDGLSKFRTIDQKKMKDRMPYLALFRMLQTLGAYGFRGLVERKPHFIESIPQAIGNIHIELKKLSDPKLNFLSGLIDQLKQRFPQHSVDKSNGLTVQVWSFSLKNGYPPLHPEHGGGFVFDCRFLPNPGRQPDFQGYSGLDEPVKQYLAQSAEVQNFISQTFSLVKDAVNNYSIRGFKHLSVAFGCTGGQHRSVYCAVMLAKLLADIPGIEVKVKHLELDQ